MLNSCSVSEQQILFLPHMFRDQFCFIFVPDIELNAKRPYIATACQSFTEYFYWEHEVWSFRKYNFQDAIKVASTHIFLRLDLPSTLIRHENGAFRERSSNRRNLKTSVFRFLEHGKSFEKELLISKPM